MLVLLQRLAWRSSQADLQALSLQAAANAPVIAKDLPNQHDSEGFRAIAEHRILHTLRHNRKSGTTWIHTWIYHNNNSNSSGTVVDGSGVV